jgi:hypothetical protein
MFEYERALLVAVALDARGVGPDGELRLFLLEASVWIMAVTTAHRSFENFVMKRLTELRLGFGVTRHAKLRLVRAEHRLRRLSGFLMRDVGREDH